MGRSAFREAAGPGYADSGRGFRVSLLAADAGAAPGIASRSPVASQFSAARKPPLAVAPFDEKTAKQHQARWAKHLHVPVVETNSIGMKLVLIPPGEFDMGSPKELIEEELKANGDNQWYKTHLLTEGPSHRVRITKPFWLGTALVTQEEYQRVMRKNPSYFSATSGNIDGNIEWRRAKVASQDTRRFPVDAITWDEAVEFCQRLSELPEEKAAKRRYQLPTEAQWEYACRAGNPGRRCVSAQPKPSPGAVEGTLLGQYAWFNDNSGDQTHAVEQKLPNIWGLYDMYGNVWQWCQDWYENDFYAKSSKDDPTGSSSGSTRVLRGGAWEGSAHFCRSAFRYGDLPNHRYFNIGFRVSQVLADAEASPRMTSRKPVASQSSTARKPLPAVGPL